MNLNLSISTICICLVLISSCSSNDKTIKKAFYGTDQEIPHDTDSLCKQRARQYVQDNWNKIGRDWIKHEEYRQYKICVNEKNS